ncbi:response regulator transcription factor [Paenimyroides ceti]
MENTNTLVSDQKNSILIPVERIQADIDYLETVKAFGRLAFNSIYIFDYIENRMVYISDNRIFLHDSKVGEVFEKSENYFQKYIKQEDQTIVAQAQKAGFEFYAQVPESKRKEYVLMYDFHLIDENQNTLLIHHKLTPLSLTQEGKIAKVMCTITMASNTTAGNIMMSKDNSNMIWKYDPKTEKWTESTKIIVSKRELQILGYYKQGLTINEISDKLCLSSDTIKFHRRKLFQKMNVRTINQALTYATRYQLI